MKKSQNQTLKMFQITSEYLDGADSATLNGLPGFEASKNEFNLNNDKLRSQYDLQIRNITGFAIDKKSIRKDLTDAALDISNRIEAFAANTGNEELKIDIHYSQATFSRLTENGCVSNCDNIYNKANELITDLEPYGIDSEVLGKFQDLIVKFSDNINRSQLEINIGKMATSEIALLFNTNMQLLEKMDLLIKMLKNTHPEFVKGYFESRNIDTPSRRPISIRFFIVDEQSKPIASALVSNSDLKIRRRTGEKGIMYLKNIKEGTYEFHISKIGFTTIKRTFDVNSGERTDVIIILN